MGRWSNERRAEEAAKAASQAVIAAKAPELPLESAGDQAPDEGTRPPPRNEPRRLAMEEILIARGTPTEPEPEPKLAAKSEPKATHAAATAAAVEPAPVIAPAATPQPAVAPAEPPVEPVASPAPIPMAKVKVDGQEFEVAQADVDAAGGVTAYQRDKASENRLAKANQTLAETRRTQAQITQWIQQQTPQQPTLSYDQFLQSKVDIIRYGTPEESAVALREVLATQQIDPNAITQNAVNLMQQSLAVDNFKKEFQDVVSNPDLLRLAVVLENDIKPQIWPHADWTTIYRHIGNRVRSAVGRQPQPNLSAVAPATPTIDTPSPESDKEARKASIVNLPTAAARAALPAETKPETHKDILNQMRKTRGIPTG